jgi:hypothetical protein
MIFHDGITIPTLRQPQDPDESVRYKMTLKPGQWAAGEVYYVGESAVIPTQFAGYYFIPTSNGLSGGSEPAFPQVAGSKIQDGGVEWVAVPYNFAMRPADVVASVAWSSDVSGVTLQPEPTVGGEISVRVSTIPPTAKQVKITARITFGNDSIDRSFIIPVSEL